MTWKCRICDSENDDQDVICAVCGSYKDETAYDIESDLTDEGYE